MEKSLSDSSAVGATPDEDGYLYQANNLPALEDVEELRWKILVGSEEDRIGTIENIGTDEDSGRVEFLEVGRGGFLGFGADRFLVPVFVIISVDEKQVKIDRPLGQLDGVPPLDFERLGDPRVSGYRSALVVPDTGIAGDADITPIGQFCVHREIPFGRG